ncbi:MAG: hypothetical protein AB1640_21025 [bacterium]
MEEGWSSPFGLDYVFILGERNRTPAIADSLGGLIGVRWVTFARVQWDWIEQKPPKDGVHVYDWSGLDDGVRQWQQYGVHILIGLSTGSGWAKAPPKDEVYVYTGGLVEWYTKNKLSDNLPKPEYADDYRHYIHTLVERYDGDGVDDMPGLRFPVLYYQLGNEYCNEIFWGGTVEDYGTLLRETLEAARQAHPDVRIVLSGVSFGEFRGFYDDEMDPVTKAYVENRIAGVKENERLQAAVERADDFSKKSMRACDLYDVVDARGPSFGKIVQCRNLLQELGCRGKQVWSAEIASNLPLEGKNAASITNYPAPARSLEYRKILARPGHKDYAAVNAWYRGMQAAHLVKSCMAALSAGADRLMVGYAVDLQKRLTAGTNLSFSGLWSWSSQKPWPAAYTYGLLIRKLDGFRSCTRIPMPDKVYVYECVVRDGKKVLVAFYDDHLAQNHDVPVGSARVEIPFARQRARLTHIIREIEVAEPATEDLEARAGKLVLELGEYPIFIEPLP